MRDGLAIRGGRRRWVAQCSALAVLACCGAAALAAGAGAAGKRPIVLVVGDSLSSEYGIARGSGWVALLQRRLDAGKRPAQVVNASVSGDTTSGGRSRLPALLVAHKPGIVILELGGNDALRGLPLRMTADNLAQMARDAKAAGARVLLVGMQVPPNYGRQYADDFARTFVQVAQREGTALVPFLLGGVADHPEAEALFQADRIHPRAQAQERMLDNVWPQLQRLLR